MTKKITITVDGKTFEAAVDEAVIANLCKQKSELWFPYNGSKAFYISEDGVVNTSLRWGDDDLHTHKLNHIFKTEAEADNKLAIINAEYIVRKRIHELNDGWVPDWGSGENNYHIMYDYFKNRFYAMAISYRKMLPNWMYIKTDELAEQLIKELPNELELILTQ